MTTSSYPDAFKSMIAWEGSAYTNDPADAGGPTKYGVTQRTLSTWLGRPASIAEVKALTLDTVAPIYRNNYWNAIRGDDLPPGVDMAVFDWGVNSGPSRAVKALQACLNVKQDGVIGMGTLAAAIAHDPVALTNAVMDRREAFLESLIRNKPSQERFRKGWFNRTRATRKAALALAAQKPVPVASANRTVATNLAPDPTPPLTLFQRFKAAFARRIAADG